ncbi:MULTISPECIES: sensor histidine kinase [Thiomicrorhabdus]|uniref:histidine kinase n=1 Tax=Thiomicrorhabdus heinhorstiae TaxID=2748010 RepID=A0ABS0BV35_9GAMM|nr:MULTISPECIES: ATP-binding protein [Thiomicrorhabdus]MBF6057640.1 hypothetical protein [Thiomicrorhabdus heinhorstiae]
MKATPQQLLFTVSLIAFLAVFNSVYFALQAPVLGISFEPHEKGLKVLDIEADSPNQNRLHAGQILTEMNGIPITPDLWIEEPDQLNQWTNYNAFFHKMTQLKSAADSHSLQVLTEQGQTIPLEVRARHLSDLPPLFWFQAFVGVCGFLIAASVFAFRQHDDGARYFALAGLGMLIFSLAASVYSTRELIIDGQTARLFSYTNQMGAIFFTAALVALLAVYPKRLRYSMAIILSAFVSWLAIWGGFVSESFPDISMVYLLTLILFAASFVLAFIQWRQTKHLPVERAALKWYLLSIYLGTGLFAALILIPVTLEIEPPASQGLMFMVFLFMFIGIAMGITRYRLFDLDRWWVAAWSWFLGGLLVIAADLVLLSYVGLGEATSLALSLALIGWLYFPSRQWLLERIQKKKRSRYGQTSRLIESLFSAEEPEQLALSWRQYVQDEWQPLSIELKTGQIQSPLIEQHAQCMRIPYLDDQHHLELNYPDSGSRLFNREDHESVIFLYELAQQALKGLKMRLQALEEKHRILGDLHDDVGSKLLSLLHRSEDPVNNELARNALRDLREVVSQPDQDNWLLSDKLSDWRIEAAERLKDAGMTLNWQQDECGLQEISYFTASHLGRVLRESLNNILKHSLASKVDVTIRINDGQLILQVQDDGQGESPENWQTGRGVSNIRHRVKKLHGEVDWLQSEDTGILLKVVVPIETA